MKIRASQTRNDLNTLKQNIREELLAYQAVLERTIKIAMGESIEQPQQKLFKFEEPFEFQPVSSNNTSVMSSAEQNSQAALVKPGVRNSSQRSFVYAHLLPIEDFTKPSVVIVDAHSVEIQKTLSFSDGMDSRVRYAFDRVFGPVDTMEDLFNEVSFSCKSILNGSMKSACIISYGYPQSGKSELIHGTGKTGSFSGSLTSCFLQSLFNETQHNLSVVKYRFSISAIEVKGEYMRDLIRSKAAHVKNLTFKQAQRNQLDSFSQAVQHLNLITRTFARTGGIPAKTNPVYVNANEPYPFSHCIITVFVEALNTVTFSSTVAQVSFIELASSQALNPKLKGADVFKEYKHLQKQFGALVEVIHGVKSSKPDQYIPWRNSNLTHLLHEVVQADTNLMTFVCMRPRAEDYNDNVRNLKFAANIRAQQNAADLSILDIEQHAAKKKQASSPWDI